MAQNSQRTAKRRGAGKPFRKGVSGNPGGRPKENAEVKALAREYTNEAVGRLAFWMRQDRDAKASVAASKELLDRGWGKSAQAFTDADGGPLTPAVVVHQHIAGETKPQ